MHQLKLIAIFPTGLNENLNFRLIIYDEFSKFDFVSALLKAAVTFFALSLSLSLSPSFPPLRRVGATVLAADGTLRDIPEYSVADHALNANELRD